MEWPYHQLLNNTYTFTKFIARAIALLYLLFNSNTSVFDLVSDLAVGSFGITAGSSFDSTSSEVALFNRLSSS